MDNKNIDLSNAETLDLNFTAEQSQDIAGDELDSFLNDSESIVEVTPVIPKPPKKETPPKGAEEQIKSSTPSEEIQKKLKEKEEETNSFNNFLEEEEIDLTDKTKIPKEKKEESVENEETTQEDEGIKSFAKDLYKMNFFTKRSEDEIEPSTIEELVDKLTEEKQIGAEELVDELAGRHGEEWREGFYSMFVNGVHPKEYINKFLEVQSFKDMDLTDESNQRRVVETGLRKQGWEEADIKEEVKRLETNSDLESVSTKYHKALVKSEEAEMKSLDEKAKVEAARVEQLDKVHLTNLNNFLVKAVREKEVNGIPVTKDIAKKAFDMAYTKRWTLPKSKEVITDLDRIFLELKKPINHDLQGQVALLFAPTFEGWEEGKKLSLDLSKIQKKAVSMQTEELFASVIKNKKQNSNTSINSRRESKF